MQSFEISDKPRGAIFIKRTPQGFVLSGNICASEVDTGIARNTIQIDGNLFIDKPVDFPLLEQVSGLVVHSVKVADLALFNPLPALWRVGAIEVGKTTSKLFPALESAGEIRMSEGVCLPNFRESETCRVFRTADSSPPLDSISLPSFQKTKTLMVVGEGVPDMLNFPQLREVEEFVGYKFSDLRKSCPQLPPPSESFSSTNDSLVSRKPDYVRSKSVSPGL